MAVAGGVAVPVTGGLDISMNHSAAVIFDGQPVDWRFITDMPTVHTAVPDVSALYTDKRKAKGPERDGVLWDRLAHFYGWIAMVMELGAEYGVERWGVENYAFGRGHNAYHIGEFGGVVRAAVMAAGFGDMELVNIGDVKDRAGLPRRSKEKPFRFCLEEFGIDWSSYDAGTTSDAGGDLADATVIALITDERMV